MCHWSIDRQECVYSLVTTHVDWRRVHLFNQRICVALNEFSWSSIGEETAVAEVESNVA